MKNDGLYSTYSQDFPDSSVGKRICLKCRRPGFSPWVEKIPWRREQLPIPLENSMDCTWTDSQRIRHDWVTFCILNESMRGKKWIAAAAAKSLQSCRTLCDPIDSKPPVPGILQARTLEWVASSFSNAWKWKVKVKLLSCVWLLATPWTAAYQAPPSVEFSRQEYWSGLALPSPRSGLSQ